MNRFKLSSGKGINSKNSEYWAQALTTLAFKDQWRNDALIRQSFIISLIEVKTINHMIPCQLAFSSLH